ncbi:MAG: PQQ-dependent sugar dehydrogenase [Bacteroidia bacterium]|nr:PQQ-dependent sugar dehydrogenase [Bacteroidia bacterium]
MKKLASLITLLSLWSIGFCQPQIVFEQVATGVSGIVDMAHANDSRLFIVDKAGLIRIMYADYSFQSTPFLDIRQRVNSLPSEMGLLGLAFHPDFNTNGIFFLNYTNNNNQTIISRFKVDVNDVNIGDPNSEEIIMTVNQPFENHNAGDMAFGVDGYLYITMGDGGAGSDPGNRGQDSLNLLGKILRIDVDTTKSYKIPIDNPFVNNPDVANEIWSIGWRNPWKFSFDRETNELWIADVGQGRFEEVNVEAPGDGGKNYGWRCYEGPNNFILGGCQAPANYVEPIFSYDHFTQLGSSITGGFVYRGEEYPNMQGYYVVGDYNSGNVWTVNKDSNGQYQSTLLGQRFNRNQISTFGENFAGDIFVGTLNQGRIYKMVDTSAVATSVYQNEFDKNIRFIQARDLDLISIRLAEGQFLDPKITLVSMDGKSLDVPYSVNPKKVEISTSALLRGLYIVKLEHKGRVFTRKIRLD